jgi:hypothetical protein
MKSGLMIKIGAKPKEADEEDMESEESDDEAGEIAAEDVLSAIASKDAAGLLAAMRSLMSYC